jgi:hypothetical protein
VAEIVMAVADGRINMQASAEYIVASVDDRVLSIDVAA